MPTLIRFFVFIAILAGLAFGSMIALNTFVEPQEKEVVVRVPTRVLLNS